MLKEEAPFRSLGSVLAATAAAVNKNIDNFDMQIIRLLHSSCVWSKFGLKLEGLAEGLQRKWSTVCLKGIAERYAVAAGLAYLLLCSSVPREQAGS